MPNIKPYTSFAFRRRAFTRGIDSFLGFRSSQLRYEILGDGWNNDRAALRSDWEVIGNDLRLAMGELQKETRSEEDAQLDLFDEA